MKCPHCGGEINPACMLGSMRSERKAKASRENGKRGGHRSMEASPAGVDMGAILDGELAKLSGPAVHPLIAKAGKGIGDLGYIPRPGHP